MTPHKKEVSKRGSARSSANWAQSHTRPSPNRATESQMLTEWHDTPTFDGKPKKSPRLRGGSNRDAAQCFKSSKPRLIGWRTRRNGIVGSEEARLRAGLRPPPKLHVRFSRMQLSRRLSDARMQEKELNRSAEQARTRRRAASLAAVSSPHYASDAALRRVRACSADLFNSFSCIL